ncbi:DUF456 domain-containing protein [Candidatus Parcubacteria bacterium]|nr:MAG: DUF456 domain-containing protein [Candidatus Parcubacteria bacterium]
MLPLYLTILFAVIMTPGIILSFIPMMPAFPFMFLIAGIYGLLDKFTHLSLTEFGILGGILVLSFIIDYSAGALGAKYGGASKKSLIWGFAGLLIGLLVFPPFGSFLGLFLAILIAEYARTKNQKKALRAASGSLFGSFAGVLVNVVLSMVFVGLFVFFALR